MYAGFARNAVPLFISAIVLFEVRAGLNAYNQECLLGLLRKTVCLPFDMRTAEIAADLSKTLRKSRIQVESSDLFIAATAIAHELPLATLNRKHFERIEGLILVDGEEFQQ
ncbi:MAG: type II toxin-antitoxin system VapC family toxin [Planctomycetaceae bacterium]|nr:type II toxin-antitoxin system VapC family toxin [Planctomycetaceae bacterium]